MIESRQNKKIKDLFKLLQKKYRDQTDNFLVFGEHGINEALKTNNVVEIFTTSKEEEGTLISEKLMRQLSPLLTVTKRVAVVKKSKPSKYSDKVLFIDGIQDPGNLGTLIRSAVGFNFNTVIASEDTVDFYNEKTVSATQGNLFYANLIKGDLIKEIKDLKAKGYQIIATDVNGGINLKKINKIDKIGLILGSEGSGIKEEIKDLANKFVKIETKDIESLNVSIAGSIIMYEVSDIND